MTAATAQQVLNWLALAASLLWLAGFAFVVVISRGRAGMAEESPGNLLDSDSTRGWFRGTAEVAGTPEDLSTRAARALVNTGMPGSIRIVEQTENILRFEGGRFGSFGLMACKRGMLRFKAVGSQRTLIDYRVDESGGRWLLILAGATVAMGFLAICAGYWLLSHFAVPSNNPGVRGQVIQMIQAIHFLWPPFLLGGLYLQRRRMIRSQLGTFVNNLPYTDPTLAQSQRQAFSSGRGFFS